MKQRPWVWLLVAAGIAFLFGVFIVVTASGRLGSDDLALTIATSAGALGTFATAVAAVGIAYFDVQHRRALESRQTELEGREEQRRVREELRQDREEAAKVWVRQGTSNFYIVNGGSSPIWDVFVGYGLGNRGPNPPSSRATKATGNPRIDPDPGGSHDRPSWKAVKCTRTPTRPWPSEIRMGSTG